MWRCLVLMIATAGCDALFHLDAIDVGADATGRPADAAVADAAPVAITFAQVNAAVPASATVVSVPFTIDQTAGDLNVVVVGWLATPAIGNVTDSAGNSYRSAGFAVARQQIYYAMNIAGGRNTVTVTFGGDTSYPDVRILEYRGIATQNALDAEHGMTGVGTAMTSGPVTTTHAYDLLVGGTTVDDHTSAPGLGYDERILTIPDGDIVEDMIVTSIGTYAATATQNTASGWSMQVAAFKGASNAPP